MCSNKFSIVSVQRKSYIPFSLKKHTHFNQRCFFYNLGYWIWSFQGKILKRVNLDKFAQLLWRPRPPTLLSPEKLKEIKKNLKSYYAQFESKDRMRQSKASKELIEKRATLMEKFNEYRSKRVQEWVEQKSRRLALRNSKTCFFLFENLFSNVFFFL